MDEFGSSVSISEYTIVVGSTNEDSNATGVNGDQNNDYAENSGAAYVFVREGITWSQQAYLKASNTETGDQFGRSVSISHNIIIVTAPSEDSSATGVNGNQHNNDANNKGAACLFVRNGNTWTQLTYLKINNLIRSVAVDKYIVLGGVYDATIFDNIVINEGTIEISTTRSAGTTSAAVTTGIAGTTGMNETINTTDTSETTVFTPELSTARTTGPLSVQLILLQILLVWFIYQ